MTHVPLPRPRRPRPGAAALSIVLRFVVLIVIALYPALVAAATYSGSAAAFNWIDASSHTKLGPSTGGIYSPSYQFGNPGTCGTTLPVIDDAITDNLPIGFAFSYGGVAFTQVRVMSNGRLQFNDNAWCGYGSPVTQHPYPDGNLTFSMRIYGADLDPSLQSEVGGSYSTPCADRASCYVSYASVGSAPNRRFVVTWNNVPEWTNFNQAAGNYNLQVVLQENGDFIYQYGAHTPGPGSVAAQIGWELGGADYAEAATGHPADDSALQFTSNVLVSNGGFEAGAGGNGTYTYQPADQGFWIFASGAGITGANSGFTSANSPPTEGRLAAFLQGQGTITQTGGVAAAGNYMLTFRLVNRANYGCQQSVAVRVDGTTVLALPVPAQPIPSEWMHVATPPFALTAGGHTVQIAGTQSVGDCTAFVDDVKLQAAPAFSPTQILGSFEEWQIGAQNYHYGAGAQPWAFAAGSGLIANGSAFGSPNAPQGAQAAFVQDTGNMTQTWTDAGGSYQLQFAAAGRVGYGTSTLTASIDGATLRSWTLGAGAYAGYSAPVTLASGPHTVRFASSGGDSFVDDVRLVATALPGTPGGFNAFETSTPAGSIAGVIHTKIAAARFAVDIVAIDTTGNSVMTSFTGDVKVEILDASDNTGAVSATACRSSWLPVAGGASTTTTFVAADLGRRTVSLAEPEAWRNLRLRMSTPATGAPSLVACSTDNFANRPASFGSLAATDADAASAGTTRSLANATVSGGNVHKAGRPFTVQATAVNSNGATTANYAGTPSATVSSCAGSACSIDWTKVADENGALVVGGTRTVRYGNNSTWTTQLISGTSSCSNAVFGDPLVGIVKECDISNLGSLALTPSATAGVIQRSATYSEAGSFALQLVDNAFAAVDASDGSTQNELTIASPYLTVGRFVPDHFDLVQLAAPKLNTFDSSACGARSFTYVGQPFGYVNTAQARVYPRNVAGATTYAYTGALWKLSGGSVAQTFAAAPVAPTLDASLATVPTLSNNNDGSGLVVGATGDKLRFVRPTATPSAPFNAAIALTWSVTDASEAGVAGNGTIATPMPLVFASIAFDAGNQFRFGSLRMVPAYGSELVDLPVLIEAQYWDGQRMATNTADQCTAVPTAALAMANYQRNLAACRTAVAPTATMLASGRTYAKLARPGSGHSGSVDLALQLGASAIGQTCSTVGAAATATGPANLPWLQGRWGGAAAFDQNPSTRASFGQYRSPLIYLRENF